MCYGIVYKIHCNPSNKDYIGQTTKTLDKRWWQHVRASHASPLVKAIRLYGPASFSRIELAAATSRENIDATEKLLIEQHNTLTPHGYNVSSGGSGWQPDSFSILSAAAKRRGTQHMNSPAARAKKSKHLRQSKAGCNLSPETHAKMSAAQKQSWLPGGKNYLRKTHPTHWTTVPGAAAAARAKANTWFRSTQGREHMRAAITGKKRSESERLNMSKKHIKDLTGQQFGAWTVLQHDETLLGIRRVHWICQCTCGAKHSISGWNLTSGLTTKCKSCSTAARIRK